MKASDLYELIRWHEEKTRRLNADDPTLRFETEVALKLGYYVNWDNMVKH